MTALPAPRAYHTVVAATAYTAPLDTTAAAGFVYAIGGVDAAGQATSTVYVTKVAPDGSVGPWATTTALPAALRSAAGSVFRGYVYLEQFVPEPEAEILISASLLGEANPDPELHAQAQEIVDRIRVDMEIALKEISGFGA